MEKRKRSFRLRPALLAAVMFLSLLAPMAPAAQGADAVTGSVSATVRLDFDQPLAELRRREVRAELWQEGNYLGAANLADAGNVSFSGYAAAVSHRDAAGEPLYGETPGFLDLRVDGLPQGNYTLRLSGRGYVTCERTVVMNDCARHLVVGTGDASFALGDFDGNGVVDAQDRELLADALGSAGSQELERFDLNGDGEIDIIDLACVNRQTGAEGQAQVLETALLAPPVDMSGLNAEMEREGVILLSGDPADLFQAGGSPVVFQAHENGEIVLPIPFREPVEMEQLQIESTGDAPILAGVAEIVDEYGESTFHAFDSARSGGAQTLSLPQAEDAVITIDLGRRVAVKKITITVTKTEDGFAAVESIQFLKEMVPLDPEAAEARVKGLTAEAGDGKVDLTWNRLPNITGYRVDWECLSDARQTGSLYVEVNRAEITGLDNLKEYRFTVTAVNGSWSGKPSQPVTAIPQPASAPKAPDMVSVTSLDGALEVGWKAAKGATWYELYYTDRENASTDSYIPLGETLTATGTTLTGLTNGVTYYLYIVAGNDMGRSGPSRIAAGTPKAVVYERPAGIPALGVLDWQDIASIRLADPGNIDGSAYPGGFTPNYMADGDYRTHWTVQNWWRNEHVIVTFRQPQDIQAVIWVPRLDGAYASSLRTYSVQVWYAGEDLSGPGHLVTPGTDHNNMSQADVDSWPNVRGNPAVTKFGVLPFTPQKQVAQISVAVEQMGYTRLSLSELMFLKYDENHRLPDEIGELFADELHTVLASGVTRERINELRRRLESDERNYYMDLDTMADELVLAQELLDGGRSSGVIVDGIDSRSSGEDSKRYGQGGSELQPLGVAAAAGREIAVYATGIPAGKTVTVYATQFNAEASAWQAKVGELVNGRNVLTIPQIGSQNTPRGGSLYITYSGTNPEGIRLHIRRATDIPVLELGGWNAMTNAERSQTISAYLAELDNYLAVNKVGSSQTDWRNVTEISTPSVLLSLPAGAVQAGLRGTSDRAAQLASSLLAWEDVLSICQTVQGISGPMESRQNIRCMQMFTGAFMYAAGNHIGIGYGSCSGMVGGAPLSQLPGGATANSLFGWGIAHEIGHNMDKLGKAEITNNIYALAIQTSDGKQNTFTSRLEASNKYAAIFNKTAQGRAGASGDVFVQLGMYWQLHLAYDGGDKPLDFFNRFFAAWKSGQYFNGASAYDDKVALTASAIANRNLTDFFTRWGMTLSPETRTKLHSYPDETRAIWYLNDQSRRDRLTGVSAGAGTVSAQASKVGDSEFKLTFSTALTSGKVQGYEIQRNDETIAFTTDTTFTDTIGSGNNRTYSYTVTAYDTLGNQIGFDVTQEFRVSYDLLVDPSEYTIRRDTTGDVQITFRSPTAVSGLRLPASVTGGGSFQVFVTEASGAKTLVRDGSFANSSRPLESDRFISYFHLANAPEDDARIGTYQAKSVTISGIPAGVDDNDVRLISYVGDDIAFRSGPTVGKMSEDYRYGDGVNDVIRKGSLVIVGTFSGDPVYNTVRIEGEFAPPDMAAANGENGTGSAVTRYLNGYALLFADEQADGIYTNISNGIFIFVPDVQAEKELQEGETSCGSENVLPSRIRAELWRTDTPDSAEGTRRTAQTMWINSPGGSELPLVVLEGGSK